MASLGNGGATYDGKQLHLGPEKDATRVARVQGDDLDVSEAGKNGVARYHEGSDSDNEDPIFSMFSHQQQRHIFHRIDRRLVSMCGLMYFISLLDRGNLGAARIAGAEEALGLDIGARYSIITLVFFIPYVIFQPFGSIAIRKVGPRNFLPIICLLWGVVMIGFGFSPNWETLMGLRIVLGVLEAGFFPGTVYLLSTWYSRYDMAKRYAVFYCIGIFSTGFGGILAFGLMQMEGLQGLGGWQWIFIIEGVLTCLIGLLGYVLLLSFPDDTKARSLQFLHPDELRFVLARVERDRADTQLEPFSMYKFLRGGLDWRIWLYAIIFGAITTSTYGLAYFLPIILEASLEFSVAEAQCLVAPPHALAGLTMFITAWISDRYKKRGLFLCVNACVAITGLAILGFASDAAVRYFGVFLGVAGAHSNIPISLTYQANNIRGQWKRAFCSATLVGMGGIGGIIGSTVFREQDYPAYVPGLVTCIGANVVIMTCVLILTIDFKKQNKRADRGEVVIGEEPGFRYTF